MDLTKEGDRLNSSRTVSLTRGSTSPRARSSRWRTSTGDRTRDGAQSTSTGTAPRAETARSRRRVEEATSRCAAPPMSSGTGRRAGRAPPARLACNTSCARVLPMSSGTVPPARRAPLARSVRGGAATTSCTSCKANEFWNGQACQTCPTGSTGIQYVMCTCATDEFWNGTACQTCPTGSFSAGGNAINIVHVLQKPTSFGTGRRAGRAPPARLACNTSCARHATDEFGNGTACQTCPTGSFSAGGSATTTSCTSCEADEFWNGQACGACPTGSIGMQYVMCTCATDEFWNGISLPKCALNEYSLGGNMTSSWVYSTFLNFVLTIQVDWHCCARQWHRPILRRWLDTSEEVQGKHRLVLDFDDPLWETDGILLPAGEDILPSPHASADAQYPSGKPRQFCTPITRYGIRQCWRDDN